MNIKENQKLNVSIKFLEEKNCLQNLIVFFGGGHPVEVIRDIQSTNRVDQKDLQSEI